MLKKEEMLSLLWENNICPCCGKEIAKNGRIGDGRKSRGGFCSLNCYAEYYKLELLEKAKRLNRIITKAKLN